MRDYGLNDFYLELSTRNPEKSVGAESDWEEATQALREAANAQNLELVLDDEGAAFYGPKISVQAKDAIGRTCANALGPNKIRATAPLYGIEIGFPALTT